MRGRVKSGGLRVHGRVGVVAFMVCMAVTAVSAWAVLPIGDHTYRGKITEPGTDFPKPTISFKVASNRKTMRMLGKTVVASHCKSGGGHGFTMGEKGTPAPLLRIHSNGTFSGFHRSATEGDYGFVGRFTSRRKAKGHLAYKPANHCTNSAFVVRTSQ